MRNINFWVWQNTITVFMKIGVHIHTLSCTHSHTPHPLSCTHSHTHTFLYTLTYIPLDPVTHWVTILHSYFLFFFLHYYHPSTIHPSTILPSIYNPSFHPTIHLQSFLPSYHPSTILPSIHNHNTELTQTKLMISDLTCIILKAWILKQLPWYPSTAPPCNI